MMRRCFVCAADMLEPTTRHLAYPCGVRRAFPIACASCGLLLTMEADPARCRADLGSRLTGRTFASDPDGTYGLDLYTLRSAATGLGLGIRAQDAEGRADLCRPHAARAAQAELYGLDAGKRVPVSLGLLCRPAELDRVLAAVSVHAAWTDDVTVLLDADAAPPHAVPVDGFPHDAVRIAARPLEGDFAAQRNALQDLARHPWMVQLDADETLDLAAARRLPSLAALAEAGAVLSVGLPRRNRVDGLLSDVYPDVQYRLNHRAVRYAGRVHERPVLDGGWARSLIALHGAIEHHLGRAHVLARSRRYESLAPGRGRTEEEAALLRPFRE